MTGSGAIYPDLRDKVVFITGGGSGIGEFIVRAFMRQGCHIGFVDIADDPSRKLASELAKLYPDQRIHFEHVDLHNIPVLQQAIHTIREKLGPVDILINNAANDERHKTPDVTVEFWDERMAVNLRHQFFAAQAVLPDMISKNKGSIINYGSTSWMKGQGGMVAYTTCKSAILGLTRSLARDYGVHNIRVNSIAPGWIMTQRQIDKWLTPETEKEMMIGQCLKRRLMPDELAKFTVFLSSDDASACTAQSYIVDGGWI